MEPGMSRQAAQDRILDKIHYVTLEELTTPRDGEVRVNRYWVYHPEKGIAFYKTLGSLVPQCNGSEDITKSIISGMYPGHEAKFVHVAYLGWVDHE
jgi:hypothetical protein